MNDRRAALELLGLTTDEPVTHDRLRRAYLRRLRAHPPERDPDGFRKLREAFERLEPWARMHDHIQAAAAEPEPSGALARGLDEPERSEAPPHRAEPATAVEAAATERPETAVNRDRPEDPAGRGNPPRDDEPGVAHEAEAAESEAEADHAPTADPPTLGDITDEILALFQAGELDAAIDLADRWKRSGVDDHRDVSPRDAQRWALTRELLDVATALPDALRRAVARGIATDNLAAECSAAEAYPALSSVQAVRLARHLGRQAPNLFTVLARPLESSIRLRDPPKRSSWGGRGPIWVGVAIVAALLRAARGCEQTPHNPDRFENIPAQGLQLDPEVIRRLEQQSRPPTGELGSNQQLEFRPLGPMVPKQP